MKMLQEMIFISEIVLQARIAKRGADRLTSSYDNGDKVELWCSIQTILVAAGNVSKILWPSKKYKNRGEKLRQVLKIDGTNILSDRVFRNHFEHYDERVEEWFDAHGSSAYIDLSMNPSLRGFGATSDHRGYNSFNNSLVFRGEILDLGEVMMAIDEILEKCRPYTPPWDLEPKR